MIISMLVSLNRANMMLVGWMGGWQVPLFSFFLMRGSHFARVVRIERAPPSYESSC
jgi:hypothetical protein